MNFSSFSTEIPLPGRSYRHFKGTLYQVHKITQPGPPPPEKLTEIFAAIDTEGGQEYQVLESSSYCQAWLKNSQNRIVNRSFIVYSALDEGPGVIVWARPLNSWLSRAAPAQRWKWIFFRLGICRGRERFVYEPHPAR